MKKGSMQAEYQKKIMDHGIAHLIYSQEGAKDIIHPFSEEGYELLADEFVSSLEKYQPLIPARVPIALEIIGAPLSEDDKERIDRTIWAHYCMAMIENDQEVREIWKTSFLFFLFTVLSTLLIFAVNSQFSELVSNLAYMPFYFFGYRVLIFILIDSTPVWRQRKWYQRLASMKLVFSGQESRSFDTLDLNEVSEEFTRYEKEAEALIWKGSMVEDQLFDDKTADLGCIVSSLGDVIRIPQVDGREHLTDVLEGYLSRAEPFLDSSVPVRLCISGTHFEEDEKTAILRAIKNTYSIRMASEEENMKENGRRILIFGIFAVITAVMFVAYGSAVDVAVHEFIVMLIWFFIDYLLEFILLTHPQISETRKTMERFRDMTVVFEDNDAAV